MNRGIDYDYNKNTFPNVFFWRGYGYRGIF